MVTTVHCELNNQEIEVDYISTIIFFFCSNRCVKYLSMIWIVVYLLFLLSECFETIQFIRIFTQNSNIIWTQDTLFEQPNPIIIKKKIEEQERKNSEEKSLRFIFWPFPFIHIDRDRERESLCKEMCRLLHVNQSNVQKKQELDRFFSMTLSMLRNLNTNRMELTKWTR